MTDEKVVKLGQKRTKKPSETQHKNHEETLNNELVYCSFCGRPNTEVLKMVKWLPCNT